MNSTINPDAVLSARADERLAHAYEQIARADDELTRVTERLSRMESDAARGPATAYRPQPSRGGSASRGLVGLVLAACIGTAAYASQSSETVRLAIAQWAPSLVSPSWLPERSRGSGQPGSAPVQLAAAETTLLQPTLSAQTPVQAQAPTQIQTQGQGQDVPPTAATAPASTPLSPELTQTLQTMAHDIATAQQGIEELKASQAQMAADNAKAIEQLRASQEQLARLTVKPAAKPKPAAELKPAEQATRATTAAPKPVVTAARKPTPKPPSQARAPAQPVQLQPDVR